MRYEIQYRPAHALATVHLEPNESVRAEASAMVSMSSNISVETQARSKAGGGILGSLKRGFLGGESFFTNLYTARQGGGHVSLAPGLCGDLVSHQLVSGETLMIQGSSYVCAPDSIALDTQFQGFKSLFSGESMFFLKATGSGPILMNAFGAVETLDLERELIVDTGHLVAFTSGLSYSVEKAGSGWIASYLSGEGFVLRLRGQGRVYLQTRNPNEYGRTVGSQLPPRRG